MGFLAVAGRWEGEGSGLEDIVVLVLVLVRYERNVETSRRQVGECRRSGDERLSGLFLPGIRRSCCSLTLVAL